MTEKELREKILVEDVYPLIVDSEDIPWPNRFTKENKIEYLELLIETFEDLEHYDKCDAIKKIIHNINNEER